MDALLKELEDRHYVLISGVDPLVGAIALKSVRKFGSNTDVSTPSDESLLISSPDRYLDALLPSLSVAIYDLVDSVVDTASFTVFVHRAKV